MSYLPNTYFAMATTAMRAMTAASGSVRRGNIIGRPMFIYSSFVTPEGQYLMRGASDRLGFIAHIVFHFFDQTRWSLQASGL